MWTITQCSAYASDVFEKKTLLRHGSSEKILSWCDQNRTVVVSKTGLRVSKTGQFVVSKTGRAIKSGLRFGPSVQTPEN